MRTIYFACVLTDGSPGHVTGSAVLLMWAEGCPPPTSASSERPPTGGARTAEQPREPSCACRTAAAQSTQHSCVCPWAAKHTVRRPGRLFPFLHFIVGSVFLNAVRLQREILYRAGFPVKSRRAFIALPCLGTEPTVRTRSKGRLPPDTRTWNR